MMDIKWKKDTRPKLSGETATINSKVFRVVMEKWGGDKHKRPRFQENRIVRDLLDCPKGEKLDLNGIWWRAGQGVYSKEEMMEFYRLIGYSVCGYSEVFDREHLSCSAWCNKCGTYAWAHPRRDCKKFVKGKS